MVFGFWVNFAFWLFVHFGFVATLGMFVVLFAGRLRFVGLGVMILCVAC